MDMIINVVLFVLLTIVFAVIGCFGMIYRAANYEIDNITKDDIGTGIIAVVFLYLIFIVILVLNQLYGNPIDFSSLFITIE